MSGQQRAVSIQVYEGKKFSEVLYYQLKKMISLKHPNLIKYLSVFDVSNKLFVVEEFIGRNLKIGDTLTHDQIIEMCSSLLNLLVYLKENEYQPPRLTTNCIMLNKESNLIKYCDLISYKEIPPTASQIRYLSPEVLFQRNRSSNFHFDSWKNVAWSLGLIITESFFGKQLLPNIREEGITNFLKELMALISKPIKHFSKYLNKEFFTIPFLDYLSLSKKQYSKFIKYLDLNDFLYCCFSLDSKIRPSIKVLLSHPFIIRNKQLKQKPILSNIEIQRQKNENQKNEKKNNGKNGDHNINQEEKNQDKKNKEEKENENKKEIPKEKEKEKEKEFENLNIEDHYYCWKKLGGDIENEFSKIVFIAKKTNIFENVPTKIPKQYNFVHNSKLIIYPKININLNMNINMIINDNNHNHNNNNKNKNGNDRYNSGRLKKGINGKQMKIFNELITFKKLLNNSSESKRSLIKYIKTNKIPDLYRIEIWTRILNITDNELEKSNEMMDKLKFSSTINNLNIRRLEMEQIEKDVVRCHQYHPFLLTEDGKKMVKMLLFAWCSKEEHKEISYWQGLDSVAATVAVLTPGKLGLAYSLFEKIVYKYELLHLAEQNGIKFKQTLRIFDCLISYHLPRLKIHLFDSGIEDPMYYSISWFLTLFSHSFSMNQIHELWDYILIKDSTFPLFIALGILDQLKEKLFKLNFSEMLTLFSFFPSMQIDQILQSANHFFDNTPPTILCPVLFQIDYSNSITGETPLEKKLAIKKILIEISNQSKRFAPQISKNDALSFLKNTLLIYIQNENDIETSSKVKNSIFIHHSKFTTKRIPKNVQILLGKYPNKPTVIVAKDIDIAEKISNILIRKFKKYVSILILTKEK
ncbi:tbc1 domain containing kinase [Anaeramoeba flamelloides]|uniref:Tbc1 domain containing kinase n=1 Tax=Anaeramoeba flamelloides TaxID=1746091 RepID=A0ABQ8XWC0_9EUKA|nr:tbc1 domain containing kinase [Anaeramoeba flamelloides]